MRSSGISMSWLLVLLMAGHTWSYPSGPDPAACQSMTPSHGATAQTSAAPFTITTSANSYTTSQPLTVTITATDAAQPFKGFFVQARRADPTLDQTVAIGTMTAPDAAKTQVMCSNGALAHKNAALYSFSSITFTWNAPATYQGHIKFRATIVVAKVTYWLNVESPMVSDPTAGAIAATTVPPTNAPTSTPISVAECGTTKGCLRVPNGCTSSCDAIVTWKDLNNGNVEMELGRSGEGWVAVGFSSDNQMGDDSVIECIRHSGTTLISQSKNVANSNNVLNNAQDGLSNMADGYINGDMVCRFQRKKLVTGRTADIFDLNTDYFLLLGRGVATQASSSGKTQHNPIPSTSPSKVAMNKNTDVGSSANVSPMIKAHGILMVIAWVMTASFGVLIARHYRKQWPGKQIAGKDVWFMLHVPTMILTSLITITAFIIIFVHAQGYSDLGAVSPAILKAHPIIGIIVTILAVINPIMGILRPHPGTSKRPIFNWAHWGVGIGARILGVIAIFLGINLPSVKPTVPDWVTWVMVGFVAFYIIVELILELHKCMAGKRRGETNMELKSPGEPGYSGDASNDESGQSFRSIILALIVIGLLGFGFCIIIAIAM